MEEHPMYIGFLVVDELCMKSEQSSEYGWWWKERCSLDTSYMKWDSVIVVISFLGVIYVMVVYVDYLFD